MKRLSDKGTRREVNGGTDFDSVITGEKVIHAVAAQQREIHL